MAALSSWALPSSIAAPRQGFPSCARPGSAALLHRRAECLALSRRTIPAVNAAISMSARVNAGAEVSVQDFLEEARELGKVHLYINTHTGQWKTRTPMEMFRYSDAEEDAWDACLVHDDGKQEMTMYVRRVATASFKQDKVLGVPYYIIQFISLRGISFSLTLMADPKTQEYEASQLKTYNTLLKKYGPDVKFSNKLHPN
ncbi:hypothetical protein SELMODRAFT_442932 [Selaginella moellendorffii]|uniref:Uncharacterized protein n=1 Tax=Selaginella moellendorffii TaxID=88036 RepID=D8RX99_SELML|nr:uncharacterized protein LOC9645445 [Selaginella moellendorffii]XP_024536506.1 uncharacterized protein LOC9645445 [Selaginella moellendorffii]EFJ23400.1 hypothetical protein SELMODRAFT_442932 [Selaginella moellendorffii]|eukprot:XP_002975771.1 uncharacterized protein LOC9645445 [Selaginella moellendorffii]